MSEATGRKSRWLLAQYVPLLGATPSTAMPWNVATPLASACARRSLPPSAHALAASQVGKWFMTIRVFSVTNPAGPYNASALLALSVAAAPPTARIVPPNFLMASCPPGATVWAYFAGSLTSILLMV
jgi:hypothetical protein